MVLDLVESLSENKFPYGTGMMVLRMEQCSTARGGRCERVESTFGMRHDEMSEPLGSNDVFETNIGQNVRMFRAKLLHACCRTSSAFETF